MVFVCALPLSCQHFHSVKRGLIWGDGSSRQGLWWQERQLVTWRPEAGSRVGNAVAGLSASLLVRLFLVCWDSRPRSGTTYIEDVPCHLK